MSHCLAISGSAGTGKSTLAKQLADRLKLPYVAEGFRTRLDEGLDPHTLSREELRGLLLELYEEAIAELDKAVQRDDGFVADRCSIDFLAFWLHYGFCSEEEMTEKLYRCSIKDVLRYHQVIILPWDAFAIEDDGRRSTNKWLQLKFQSLFEGLAHRFIPFEKLFWMPAEPTDIVTRVSMIIDRLEKQV